MSNLSAFSMWDLFRGEVESQMRVFTDGLLAVESGGASKEQLAAIMRAAHSIKGAARIVQLEAAVQLAHSMEDCLVAVQEGSLTLGPSSVDILLSSGDFLAQLSTLEEAAVPAWVEQESSAIALLLSQLADVRTGKTDIPAGPVAHPVSTETGSPSSSSGSGTSVGLPDNSPVATAPPDAAAAAITKSAVLAATVAPPPPNAPGRGTRTGGDRAIRITAQTLNRLMGLAGESLVQSRWFEPFYESLLGLKKRHMEINELIESLQPHVRHSPEATATLATVKQKLQETRRWSAERRAQLDVFGVRAASLSDRLYREVVASRMRPFGDGVEGFPRMVRDLSRQLGKQAQLEILGANTEVDREILDRLEAPLNHAIRNSVDHGIERPEERIAAGKPPVGTIVLEARHRAGLFVLVISDDGRGVEIEALRRAVIAKGLASSDMAANFSEAELLEFLFLPGFSTAHTVTDISGRGVGLDAVQEMAKSVGGMVSISTRSGKGLYPIQLELPCYLTACLCCALSSRKSAASLLRFLWRARGARDRGQSLRSFHPGRPAIFFNRRRARGRGLRRLKSSILPAKPNWEETVPVVLLGDRSARYGLAVDKFVGEYEMVVRPLDARLR